MLISPLGHDSQYDMKIGCMVWRIGPIVDFYRQVQWIREHGFEEISFHTHPGEPGKWQGFDVLNASPADVEQLKTGLQGFEIDVHAPIKTTGNLDSTDPKTRRSCVDEVYRTLSLSEDIGAKTVTIHPGSWAVGRPQSESMLESFVSSLFELDELAEETGVKIGIESTSHYELPDRLRLRNIGLTLDIGHMFFRNGEGYRDYGSIGKIMEKFAPRIYLIHMHDFDPQHRPNSDHLPIGWGIVDFVEIISALKAITYDGSLCMEINTLHGSPPAPPEAILESRDKLQSIIGQVSPAKTDQSSIFFT